MNYREIFIKSTIKFSIQAILLFLGFMGSAIIWKQQFRDNQRINNRKEAILLMQETINIVNERDIKTRRLIGFFSKRWDNLSADDDKAYYETANDYRNMIFDWNANNLSISAKIGLTYGNEIRSQFDSITVKFAELNNFSIEKKLLKNSVASVKENTGLENLDQYLGKLNQVVKDSKTLMEGMNKAVTKNELFK